MPRTAVERRELPQPQRQNVIATSADKIVAPARPPVDVVITGSAIDIIIQLTAAGVIVSRSEAHEQTLELADERTVANVLVTAASRRVGTDRQILCQRRKIPGKDIRIAGSFSAIIGNPALIQDEIVVRVLPEDIDGLEILIGNRLRIRGNPRPNLLTRRPCRSNDFQHVRFAAECRDGPRRIKGPRTRGQRNTQTGCSGSDDEHIAAFSAIGGVDAVRHPVSEVVARSAQQFVVAGPAPESVGAAAAIEIVVCRPAAQHVIAFASEHYRTFYPSQIDTIIQHQTIGGRCNGNIEVNADRLSPEISGKGVDVATTRRFTAVIGCTVFIDEQVGVRVTRGYIGPIDAAICHESTIDIAAYKRYRPDIGAVTIRFAHEPDCQKQVCRRISGIKRRFANNVGTRHASQRVVEAGFRMEIVIQTMQLADAVGFYIQGIDIIVRVGEIETVVPSNHVAAVVAPEEPVITGTSCQHIPSRVDTAEKPIIPLFAADQVSQCAARNDIIMCRSNQRQPLETCNSRITETYRIRRGEVDVQATRNVEQVFIRVEVRRQGVRLGGTAVPAMIHAATDKEHQIVGEVRPQHADLLNVGRVPRGTLLERIVDEDYRVAPAFQVGRRDPVDLRCVGDHQPAEVAESGIRTQSVSAEDRGAGLHQIQAKGLRGAHAVVDRDIVAGATHNPILIDRSLRGRLRNHVIQDEVVAGPRRYVIVEPVAVIDDEIFPARCIDPVAVLICLNIVIAVARNQPHRLDVDDCHPIAEVDSLRVRLPVREIPYDTSIGRGCEKIGKEDVIFAAPLTAAIEEVLSGIEIHQHIALAGPDYFRADVGLQFMLGCAGTQFVERILGLRGLVQPIEKCRLVGDGRIEAHRAGKRGYGADELRYRGSLQADIDLDCLALRRDGRDHDEVVARWVSLQEFDNCILTAIPDCRRISHRAQQHFAKNVVLDNLGSTAAAP